MIASLLRSLLISSILSFSVPVLLLAGVLVNLILLGYVPGFEAMAEFGLEQIYTFLATFGNGQPLEGILIIGLVCSLVGSLFDTYVFYQRQVPHRNW